MEKYLSMVFKTDEDKKVSLRVSVPREDLDSAEVKAVMDIIIAKNVIHSTSGDLIGIDSTYLVETCTTNLAVSEL